MKIKLLGFKYLSTEHHSLSRTLYRKKQTHNTNTRKQSDTDDKHHRYHRYYLPVTCLHWSASFFFPDSNFHESSLPTPYFSMILIMIYFYLAIRYIYMRISMTDHLNTFSSGLDLPYLYTDALCSYVYVFLSSLHSA